MRRASLILASLLAFQAIPASAGLLSTLSDYKKPNIKIGQLALHPYYGLSLVYDDNIYLVPPDKNGHALAGGGRRGSWIMTNDLGLNAELPIGEMHKVNAGYNLRSDVYNKVSSANNAVTQKVDVAYSFKGSVSKARAFDAYVNTQDPQFNPNSTVVAGELVKREQRWQNTAGVNGEYFLGDKFFFGADAQDTVHKYLSRSLGAKLNRSEALFGFKTGYKLQPKTRAYLAVHRGLTHYSAGKAADHIANHRDWLMDFGLEGEFTGKLKGQVQTGMNYREHDKDNVFAQVRPVTRNWTVAVKLNYKPTETNVINVTANRAVNDAISGGNFYITNGLALDASHKWNKLVFSANTGVQIDKYSEAMTLAGYTAMRRDDTYSYGLKTDYKLREWFLVGVGYKHTRRHSIFSEQYNYKDSKTSFDLKLTF